MPKRPSELINGSGNGSLPTPGAPTTATRGTLGTLLIVILAGVLGYLALTRLDWGSDHKRGDDHHEQKDDDHKKQDDKRQSKLVAKPGFLIVVSERIATGADVEAADRVKMFCADQTAAGVKLEYRNPDKNDTSEPIKRFIAHAASKNVQPPFVLYRPDTGTELGGVIKLPPADATDAQILEVFKQ